MVFIIKIAKTIRNHWKKSAFAGALLTYGIVSGKSYLDTQELMRVYCQKAATYGKEPIPIHINPRNVTVILNPNANKRKASEEFEKYCAPLLYLAGISVDIIKTESEGHAKTLIESVDSTDAIVVAGGDGTLLEVVTGLLRRTNENTNNLVPLGILPLGKNNTVAKNFFPTEKNLEKVRCLADATMAVIEEMTKSTDVMKIEVLDDDAKEPNKPIYAVVGLKWGAYRDAEAKKDSYWYFGTLRKYATYVFNGLKNNLSWNCEATLNYSSPCEGCSNCYKDTQNEQSNTSWFHKFIRRQNPQAKYLSIDNPDCQKTHQKLISTADLALLTSNAIPRQLNSKGIPKLQIQIGPGKVEYIDFVKNGWNSENGRSREVKEIIEARTVEINPQKELDSWFSIDNEYYEVKPVKITLLPKVIKIFCRKEDKVVQIVISPDQVHAVSSAGIIIIEKVVKLWNMLAREPIDKSGSGTEVAAAWWRCCRHLFIRRQNPQAKYLSIDNPDCQKTHQKLISTADLALLTSNAIPRQLNSKGIPKLQIQIGPGKVEYIDFVKNGWNSENGRSREVKEIIEARTVEINPQKELDSWFSIDNEYYEVKPVKITLLPKVIKIFCRKEDKVV